jgi:hypothetical protein
MLDFTWQGVGGVVGNGEQAAPRGHRRSYWAEVRGGNYGGSHK